MELQPSNTHSLTQSTRPRISKTLRSLVWDKYVGLNKGSSKCICGIRIYQLNFECGHIVPYSKGGPTTLDNLRPICSMCNKSMGNMHFDIYVDKLSGVLQGMVKIKGVVPVDSTTKKKNNIITTLSVISSKELSDTLSLKPKDSAIKSASYKTAVLMVTVVAESVNFFGGISKNILKFCVYTYDRFLAKK